MFKSIKQIVKEVFITIYEKMCLERQRLDKQIKSLHSQIKKLPEGNFFCTRNGSRYKWYHSIKGNQKYIPKSERKLAEALVAKKYLTSVYEELINEKEAIDLYLQHHAPSKSDKMFTDMPEYQKLLSPYFKPLSQELEEWMNSPYKQSEKYSENLIHKTTSGNRLRSKSEAMIQMILKKYHIPFRYECALQVGDTIFYPDFTIRHPRTGEEYYWENFGKMDDEKYARNTGGKLQMYIANGITPGVKLITTYETKNKPLTTETIENLISEYFL